VTETAASRPPTLEELRARREEIEEIAARHGIRNIRVYGSVARGEAREGSDVDFLVDVDEGRSLLDLAGFYGDIQELLGCEVDVGTTIKERLREQVEAELVPL
jgi:predicted nucleotidyltransferase